MKEYTIDEFLSEIDDDPNAEVYREIFERERPDYPIVKVEIAAETGRTHLGWRWKTDPLIDMLFKTGALSLNILFANGADKNDPLVRQLYRQLGYSLFGYWEVFYWELNNANADEYEE